MYEVDLLFFFCWWHVILKNRLQYKSTKILHGHQWQVNFFISISVRTDLPNMLSHTVWFDLLIKVELRLKCDLVLISAVITVKVRDLNFSVKTFSLFHLREFLCFHLTQTSFETEGFTLMLSHACCKVLVIIINSIKSTRLSCWFKSHYSWCVLSFIVRKL